MEEIVLSWRIEEILNQNLYTHQIERIPSEFQSVEEYLQSFKLPLIEEVRAELSSCFEAISQAHHFQIKHIQFRDAQLRPTCTMDILDNGFACEHKLYRPSNGDTLLLSNLKPETSNALLRHGVIYCLAIVTKVEEIVVEGILMKRFTISVPPMIAFHDEINMFTCATFLTNIITNIRIWSTLASKASDRNLTLIKKVLSRNNQKEATSDILRDQGDPVLTSLLNHIGLTNLNHSQMEVVESSINAIKYESSSLKLVWGPPGSGKTKTLVAILWCLMKMQIQTLICAPSNIAVEKVCFQLLQCLKSFDEKNGHSNGIPSTLAGVVLFGSAEQIDTCGDMEDVLLENRIFHLENCLSPTTGWKHGVVSMIDLLEDCIENYHLFVKERKKAGNRVIMSFGGFLRARFSEVENHLRSCFLSMFVHLPRRYLSPDNCASLVSLLNLLRQMGRQLRTGVLTDDQLKEIFEASTTAQSSTQVIERRAEILHLLRYLESTVEISLHSVTKGIPLRDFCLQNATVLSSVLQQVHICCMMQIKVKHALLVGDHFQLPALLQSPVNKRAGFARSLFERMMSLGIDKHLLNMQYYMHPSISLFPNNRFYNGRILNGANVIGDEYNKNYSDFMFGSYAFIDVTGGREEIDDSGKSLINWVEVAIVVHLIKGLYECWKSTRGKLKVGVISAYTAQVRLIKKKIGNNYNCDAGFEVRVELIHEFQGQQDDVVILSTVRCNSEGDVGVIQENQQTNVALTRARHCLWIVGSAGTLIRSGAIWSDIVIDAENRGCLFHAMHNEDLVKVISKVKDELDQLDELLNPSCALFQSAKWKVVFSSEFSRSFGRLRSIHTRRVVMQIILRIAGGWRSKRRNVDTGDSSGIAKVYKVAELYLVWSVDLEKDTCSQIVKLWDLLPLALVGQLIKRMDHMFSMFTEAYLERCKAVSVKGMVEVPMTWKGGEDSVQYKENFESYELISEHPDLNNTASSLLENSKVNESLLLLKFYALSSGAIQHLLVTHDGLEVDIPFELNDQEDKIVRFPCSSFILGRSGTGKTTVLTTKLVRREQLSFIASHGFGYQDVEPSQFEEGVKKYEEADCIKQIFITVSAKLCFAIRFQVNRLLRFVNCGESSVSGPLDYLCMHDNIDQLDDFADIPDNFNELTADNYPLIITFRKFLMMLDGTLNSSFFDKLYVEWGASFHQGVFKSRAVNAIMQSKEVHFDKFLGSYWPRFNTGLTKNLDASTVFTEIISHIKGGFGSQNGFLTRDEYILFPKKRLSSLRRECREIVYDIFLQYEEKKCWKREFDLGDFVNSIHRRLRTDGYMGCKMDFVYVDEVQDLTIKQIALLKNVCNNFKEGFVFAGDTAQTIEKGINFRFEDIRSLFYLEFLSKIEGKDKEIRLSDTFQLSQNFRTHIGVLKLAQSVIDLLYYYFPLAVDKLNPETSLIHGDPPILLEYRDFENAVLKIFGGRRSTNEKHTAFGAEQVILVRDDSVKKEILEIVGARALVLTISESKGLEFQDVLLFNFFGSSPMENKWRVLYGYMDNQGILDPSMAKSYTFFNPTRHHLLCSELKQLYVAITRTRQRLWICENSNEYCNPIFDYWKRLGLVQAQQLDSISVEAMHAASTREDWRKRAIELFNKAQFEMARMCFAKAGDVKNEKWARAASLVELAEYAACTNLEKAQTSLHEAAEIYRTLEMPEKVASCYIKLGDYAEAGTIYLKECGTPRLEDAGDCFLMAKHWERAADMYFKAKCFCKCTEACFRGELFALGLDFIEMWRQENTVSPDNIKIKLEMIRNDYIKRCANHFYERDDFEQMMHFVRAFQSLDLIRDFLKSKKLVDQLVREEINAGNLNEALQHAQMKLDVLLEAEVWSKMGSFERATQLIMLHVIKKSLWSRGHKGWPPKPLKNSEDLFTSVKDLARKVSDCFYHSICSELYLLNGKQKTLPELWRLLNEAVQSQNIRLEFLSLRALIHLHLTRKNSEYLIQLEPVIDLKRRFPETMDEDKVSLHTLVHIWGRWKRIVHKVISALCKELCSDYLGVRIIPGLDENEGDEYVYHVLNSNASWIKTSMKAFLQNVNKGQCLMRRSEYISCAKRYWDLELFDTGRGVVKKLEFLVLFSHGQPSEIWDLFSPLELRNRPTRPVPSDYFRAVTGINQAIDQMLSDTKYELTYGQLGRICTFLLICARLPENWFLRIMKRVENMPEWGNFLANVKRNFDCGFERKSFAIVLQRALQATYNADWEDEPDYMSLHCFLFLLELLVFFASSCLGTAGYMIATRSTLSQIVLLRGYGRFWDSPLEMVSDDNTRSGIQSLFEFIIRTVEELLGNESVIREWMYQCHLPTEYYHTMTLRLTVVLHLAYLNKMLLGKSEVSCDQELSDELQQSIRLVVLADAFASVEDPLVVIGAKGYHSLLPPSKCIFFCFNDLKNRRHVMSVLFPEVFGISAMLNESFSDVPSTCVTNKGTQGSRFR